MSLGRVSESPGEAVSPLPSSPLFLWWIHVFFALRVGRGLGVPWSRCYLWSWEDTGKHVNPTSAFRSPPNASFILGSGTSRKQSPEPAKYFLLNTRNPEHGKNSISWCGHCHSQCCLWELGHFPPSLLLFGLIPHFSAQFSI